MVSSYQWVDRLLSTVVRHGHSLLIRVAYICGSIVLEIKKVRKILIVSMWFAIFVAFRSRTVPAWCPGEVWGEGPWNPSGVHHGHRRQTAFCWQVDGNQWKDCTQYRCWVGKNPKSSYKKNFFGKSYLHTQSLHEYTGSLLMCKYYTPQLTMFWVPLLFLVFDRKENFKSIRNAVQTWVMLWVIFMEYLNKCRETNYQRTGRFSYYFLSLLFYYVSCLGSFYVCFQGKQTFQSDSYLFNGSLSILQRMPCLFRMVVCMLTDDSLQTMQIADSSIAKASPHNHISSSMLQWYVWY